MKLNDKIHFKSVKTLKMDHQCYKFNSSIPFTFDALEVFEWRSLFPLPTFVVEFIRNNPTMNLLSITDMNNLFTHDKVIELKKSFAFVKEFEFSFHSKFFLCEKKIPILLDYCK